MKCVLCYKKIKDKYGHNADPIKSGRCCSRCNYILVIPFRLKLCGNKVIN